ncbi:hydrogenase [Sphingomonas sp. DBB INV C78]|uniref:cytochrome b/b6 domain-containing protein n=1 Tax=Sphingomonas sp. DBB INV C78 TaxID=3349434 RepID=UPI0036D429D1
MTDIAKPTEPAAIAPSRRVLVWDLPVRLFHWSLVLLIGAAWWTAEQRELEWHRLAGYAILTLILFRLAWGIWGSTTARFSHFVASPVAVRNYLSGLPLRRPWHRSGHNPLGGWSVLAMLGLLAAQVLLGLFAVDVDGMESGPLSYLVDFDAGRLAAETHALTFNLLLGLIGLHLGAILFHRLYGGKNLVAPMIHGRADQVAGEEDMRPASNLSALLIVAALAGAIWFWVG